MTHKPFESVTTGHDHSSLQSRRCFYFALQMRKLRCRRILGGKQLLGSRVRIPGLPDLQGCALHPLGVPSLSGDEPWKLSLTEHSDRDLRGQNTPRKTWLRPEQEQAPQQAGAAGTFPGRAAWTAQEKPQSSNPAIAS